MPLHRRFALLLLALCLPLVHAVAMRGFMLADLHTAGADRALVWVEGTPAQLDALVPVKNRYITAPFPAWTAVGVTELYEPTAVTEIKLTLRKPE